MLCQKCGAENSDSATFCIGCGAALTMPDSEKVTGIRAMIQTKEMEIKNTWKNEPFSLILICGMCILIINGYLIYLTILIIPLVGIIIGAVIWGVMLRAERQKLMKEIKELQAELNK